MKMFCSQNQKNKQSIGIVLVNDYDVNLNSIEINYYIQIADQLKDAGHQVEFLIINPRSLVDYNATSGCQHLLLTSIRDAGHIAECAPCPECMPNLADNGQAAEVPFLAYEFLKDKNYDVIHFQDYAAPAHYYILARREGLIRHPSAVAVHVNQPLIYRLITGRTSPEDYSLSARCYMERNCIEHADTVYLRSIAVKEQLENLGLRFPEENTFIAPNPDILAPSSNLFWSKLTKKKNSRAIKELLFASPVNQSEGFTTFVYALDILSSRNIGLQRVSVFGDEDKGFPGFEFLERHRSEWPFHVQFLPSASLRVLQMKIEDPEVLVVFPAFYHSDVMLPNVVLAAGRPLLASETSDLSSILPKDLHDHYFVARHHLAWAERIEQVLQDGIRVPTCRVKSKWHGWWLEQHKNLFSVTNEYRKSSSVFEQPDLVENKQLQGPMVSVCVAHFNRPETIGMVLDSIQAQTFRDFEVIVVDDGSKEEKYKQLELVLAEYPEVRLIRQENRYLGASRNTGAKHARGKFLMFMDDDNYAESEELETFVRVAEYTGADILTCFSRLFTGKGVPDRESVQPVIRMPFGPDLYYGLVRNGYGDSNCFVRRSAWEELGGFTEHYRIGLDDHEFFTRATISGYKLLVIPESLFFYRMEGTPMRQYHVNRKADFLRVIEPYLKNKIIDPELLPLVFTLRNVFKLR